MSSSQPPFSPDEETDHPMMEAPDSPPEPRDLQLGPSSSQQTSTGGSRVNGEQKINHGAPGSSWNTKKFDEEYTRATAQLLDQNWDPIKYGDPLLR